MALELLYGCGLRCAELIGLNLHDADLNARTLRVRGKGNKERVVPYGPPAHAALLRWLQARKHFALTYKKGDLAADLLTPRAPLLLSPTGRRAGRPLIAAIVHRRIHAFLPGHASVATTQIYTHVTPTRLRAAFDAAFPRK